MQEISEDFINKNETLKSVVDDADADDNIIPISNISTEIMKIILKYHELESLPEHFRPLSFRDPKRPLKQYEKNWGAELNEEEQQKKMKCDSIYEEWNKEFFGNLHSSNPEEQGSKNYELLCHLIEASNFLNYKTLYTNLCAYFAELIRGNSADELRKKFGITNDFSDEEFNDSHEKLSTLFAYNSETSV